MKRSAYALAAVLLFAFRAAGEERLVLPGVARANGVGGSRFVSTAWLHNPSDSPLAIDLALVAATGRAGQARLVLGPRETRRVEDPVDSLFGLESAAGGLTARADGPFLLRGVTANVADPRGTYGLALPSLRESEALKSGETGVVPWLTHTVAAGAGFRTNVAVVLLEPGTEVLVTIVDDTGLVRGEQRLVAADALFWQQPVTELVSDAEIPLGRVEVRVLRGSAVAYAAVNAATASWPPILPSATAAGAAKAGCCSSGAIRDTASAAFRSPRAVTRAIFVGPVAAFAV